MNHFTLPDGNVQISFSGGRTSGYMLHSILEANGGLPGRCQVVFANTGREMPATLDFVQEVSDRWSVPITWVEDCRRRSAVGAHSNFAIVTRESASQDGEPFANVIQRKKMLPNVGKRFCTTELKVLPAKRFLRSLGWHGWTSALGIRADESRRVKPSRDALWVNWHPLVHAGVRKSDVLDFWSRQPFDLRLENTSNCDGCFLKSEANRAEMWREHPDRMAWWVEQEAKMGATFIVDQPYQSLGDYIGKQGDWIFNTAGALCQADEGDCTG